MMKYLDHIRTPRSLVLMFDEGSPITVNKDQKAFQKILKCIADGQTSKIPALANTVSQIESSSGGKFKVVHGVVKIDGEELPQALSDKLASMVDTEEDTTPLVNFWNNLKHNPSESSREDLYAFLRHNHVPITPDGCFVGYKGVNENYTDMRTGRMDNSPGRVIWMPRSKVDPDRNNTCSTGLHVAAFHYAKHEYCGDRIIKIKVNPKYVVAVPPDYNEQKIRVCEYTVIGDYDAPTEMKEHVLVDTEVRETTLRPVRGFLKIPRDLIGNLLPGDGRKPIFVVITDKRSRFVLITRDENQSNLAQVHKFNRGSPVFVVKAVLESAKIDGAAEYSAKRTNYGIEIRRKCGNQA